ncbi:M36 family metallopeptidase [Thalassotalea sp. Y01]|uniref:M36 family metallopeptidase n=1 Tax=Thalassotalea sp. Y01 TaxID=2729613 RepID=UPI00145D2427|nr:M36 family metallopeptidase [Thalassotalea sp. Y01]NMP14804.1 GlyGly-CTERM sorting domain-containing protein [Thalassotalea sp. Y01]
MLKKKLPLTLAISSAMTVFAVGAISHDFKQSVTSSQQHAGVAKPYQMASQFDSQQRATVQWFDNREKQNQLNFVADKKQQIEQAAATHFARVASEHGFINNGASQAKVSTVHAGEHGPIIMRYQQQVNGVDVFSSQINVVMDQNLNAIASTGTFAPVVGEAASLSALPGDAAKSSVVAAFRDAGVDVNHAGLTSLGRRGKFDEFEINNQADLVDGKSWGLGKSAAQFIYYPMAKGVEPAFMINLQRVVENETRSEMMGYIVSAVNQRILHKGKLEADHSFRYRLYAETESPFKPFDSPTTIEVSPYPIGLDPHSYGDYQQHLRDSNLVSIDHAGVSTQDPWLPAGSQLAQGNNVWAFVDKVPPEGFDPVEDLENERIENGDYYLMTSSAGTFSYPYNYRAPASEDSNVKAAMTSMFYVNNFLHDWFYDSGFDEKAGNAQYDNYGRGGLQRDPLEARVDFNSANNASMATPPDGQVPIMRMYPWGMYELGFEIRGMLDEFYTEDDATDDNGEKFFWVPRFGRSVFGPSTFTIEDDKDTADIIENELVIAYDGEGVDGQDLCEPAINPEQLRGKTAVIRRGNCNFFQKAFYAQAAGATAYLMTNHVKEGEVNAAGNAGGTINMALGPNDDGSDMEIPGVFLSYEHAEPVYLSIDAGETVRIDVEVETDQNHSAFDTSIVAHEWGHYLTNRLIHNAWGLMQWQGASLGEGWSDFIALMLMLREDDRNLVGNEQFAGHIPMSTFVGRNLIGNASFAEGIRRFPYTTDMNVNGLTLGHIAFSAELPDHEQGSFHAEHPVPNNEVHNAGEVWTAALWEVYIALHNERSDLNFDMVEKRMKEYLVASLKITPYWPTFTEARDALLAVTAATDLRDFDIMLKAFAKRGFGLDAVSPDRTDFLFDNVREGFATQFPSFVVDNVTADYQYLGNSGFYCDIDESLDVNETMQISLHLKNLSNMPLTGIYAVIDTISDVTLAVDGVELVDGRLPLAFHANQYGEIIEFPFEVTLHSADPLSTVRFDISFESDNPEAIIPPIGTAWTSSQTDIIRNQNELTRFDDNTATYADWKTTAENVSPAAYGNAVFPWVLDNGFGANTLGIRQGQMFWGAASPTRVLTTLESPEVTVNDSGDFAFEFFHVYEFEVAEYRVAGAPEDAPWTLEYWDGGVIELSVDGGEWQDITEFNAIMSDPYDAVIHGTFERKIAESQNPLGYRMGYAGQLPGGEDVRIVIPEGILNGKNVRVRFAIGTDEQAPTAGWFIDDFAFENTTAPAFSAALAEQQEACGNRVPMINVENRQSFVERTNGQQASINLTANVSDVDGDDFQVSWQQISGPDVELNNANSTQVSFIAPVINRNEELRFEVTATDTHNNSRSKEVIVSLLDVNIAPTVESINLTVTEGDHVRVEAVAEDGDMDALLYSWQQIGGDTVQMQGARTQVLSFNAPNVDDTQTFEFSITVTDGSDSATASAMVTVEPRESNVSSGGSFGWLTIFLLPLVARLRATKVQF